MSGGRPTKRQRKSSACEISVGPVPDVEVQVKLFEACKPHLLMEDLQALLSWLAGDGIALKWVLVRGRQLVNKICIVQLPGLQLPLYSQAGAECLPKLSARCPICFPTKVDARQLRDHSYITDFFFRRPRKEHITASLSTAQACAIASQAKFVIENAKKEVETIELPATSDSSASSTSSLASSLPSSCRPSHSTAIAPTAQAGPLSQDQADAARASGQQVVTATLGVGMMPEVYALPEEYLLSMEQLVENKYPVQRLASDPFPAGFVKTRRRKEGTQAPDNQLILAMDCEMCVTKDGYELTRVTVVDMDYHVVYDTYVKPHNEIIDYVTKFSGITEEIMAGCTTTLEDVHHILLGDEGGADGLIMEDTILLGHSLENDLTALKLIHHRVIDTAILYPHPQGPPYKSALRWLVHHFLRKQIQGFTSTSSHNPVRNAHGEIPMGHDSQIDASVCMELLVLKLKHGPSFGLDNTKTQNVLQVIAETRTFRVTCIDVAGRLKRYSPACTDCIVATSDEDALVKGVAVVRKASKDLVVLALHSLSNHYQRRKPASEAMDSLAAMAKISAPSSPPPPAATPSEAVDLAGTPPQEATPDDPAPVQPSSPAPSSSPAPPLNHDLPSSLAEERAILQRWDQGLDDLYAAAPPNTVFLVFTGQGFGADTVDKANREEVDNIRRGLAWIFVKSSST